MVNNMAHFAKVVDGVVTQVIVAEPDFFNSFVDTSAGEWIKTSYNTRGGVYYENDTGEIHDDQSLALRKNFASIGFTYDRERDAFIPPKPFPSWVLNEFTCWWQAPVARPKDDKPYSWNEDTNSWVELEIGNG